MISTQDVYLAQLTLLYIACIEQENNVDDEFTEDVRTFLISDFLSALDKYFSGVLTILISKEFCRRASWVRSYNCFYLSYYIN